MNLLKLLLKAITSNGESDAPPRSDVYHWRCKTCGDRYVGSGRQHVGSVAASHRRRTGGKCPTPKVYPSKA